MAFPQRVGSARSGCGSSRVVSARTAGGRIGSARPSSDTRRPKLHTGRPSSAPPGHTAAPAHAPSWPAARLAGHTHAPHRTTDVSHLNLRVEGKSVSGFCYLVILCRFWGNDMKLYSSLQICLMLCAEDIDTGGSRNRRPKKVCYPFEAMWH